MNCGSSPDLKNQMRMQADKLKFGKSSPIGAQAKESSKSPESGILGGILPGMSASLNQANTFGSSGSKLNISI